ncbi:MAG: GNAT family N-acetyltransferase [Terriglobia bacterium]|jgi:ribosomal protein S18 acetylase RimI-like enzyme
MGISTSITRLSDFYRRHGSWATIRRASVAATRALFSSRSVLFYCDLARLTTPVAALPSFLEVERKSNAAELSAEDLQEMTGFWSPKLVNRNMKERFGKRASLWLIKSAGRLAGYGWTLWGSTVEPHYFPLGHDDVHLFDFHVFPQYRGRGMNPLLVTYILQSLAAEGAGRAFIEAAEWNQPQLSSLFKTPFRCLGKAWKLTFLGRTIVYYWAKNGTLSKSTKVTVQRH